MTLLHGQMLTSKTFSSSILDCFSFRGWKSALFRTLVRSAESYPLWEDVAAMRFLTFPFRRVFDQRELLAEFGRRSIQERYKRSVLGLFWTVLNPLLVFSVYLFVFSIALQGRFNYSPSESRMDFGLGIFAGLIIYTFFAEVTSISTSLISSHPNLVSKIVFPLEILPIAYAAPAILQLATGYGILLFFVLLTKGLTLTSFLFSVALLSSLILGVLGLGLIVSALGVFFRDLSALISTILLAVMFLSAIFYSPATIPMPFRRIVELNPLANLIDDFRRSFIWDFSPNWHFAIAAILGAAALYFVGFWVFRLLSDLFIEVL
jgi:lipopolysaccharide transport system permease protein